MIMSLILFENEFLNIVSISFTALILNELIMVALEITIWCGPFFLVRLDDRLTRVDPLPGTSTWSLRRLSRCCCMPSVLSSYPSILVRISILPQVVDASECAAFCRPVVRYLCALRLEGGGHRGSQRFPIVCDKVHQEQDLSRCFK